jgi:hypothetical protein
MYKNCTKRSVEAVILVCVFPIDFSRRSTCVWNSCHTAECEGFTSLNKHSLPHHVPILFQTKRVNLSYHFMWPHASLLPRIFKICDGF